MLQRNPCRAKYFKYIRYNAHLLKNTNFLKIFLLNFLPPFFISKIIHFPAFFLKILKILHRHLIITITASTIPLLFHCLSLKLLHPWCNTRRKHIRRNHAMLRPRKVALSCCPHLHLLLIKKRHLRLLELS